MQSEVRKLRLYHLEQGNDQYTSHRAGEPDTNASTRVSGRHLSNFLHCRCNLRKNQPGMRYQFFTGWRDHYTMRAADQQAAAEFVLELFHRASKRFER